MITVVALRRPTTLLRRRYAFAASILAHDVRAIPAS